jgi:hypothetical protein
VPTISEEVSVGSSKPQTPDQANFKQTTKQTLSKAYSKPQAKFSKNKNFNIVTMGEVISDGELESLW